MSTTDSSGPGRRKDSPSRARRAFLTIIGRTDELPTQSEVVAEACRRPGDVGSVSAAPGVDSRARRAAAALAADGITNPTSAEVVRAANAGRGGAAA